MHPKAKAALDWCRAHPKTVAIAVLILFALDGRAWGGEATVNCNAPTLNADNSALTDLAGYRFYYGTDPAQLTQYAQVGPAVCRYVHLNLAAGPWYFAVSALKGTGTEGPKSIVVSKAIAGRDLCMVEISSTGKRTVYLPTATGARGAKVGDLNVGTTLPVAGTVNPMTRPECSCTDLKTWSGVVYSRVPAPAGFVSGCRAYGQH